MKKNALWIIAAAGFAASLVVAGCTVTSDSSTDGGAGSGGSGGSSGTSGTGGTAGASGTGGTAGASGTGGSAGQANVCNPSDPQNTACDTCVQTNCCPEWTACTKDANCPTETACVLTCVHNAVLDGGTADDATLGACGGQCATGSTISDATNTVIGCMNNDEAAVNCRADCLQQ